MASLMCAGRVASEDNRDGHTVFVMSTTEDRLTYIQENLQRTTDELRVVTQDFQRLQSEVFALRAAIVKHAQASATSRQDARAHDRELHASQHIQPRDELIRAALIVVEAARNFATLGREGEELSRRALYAAVQDYDALFPPSPQAAPPSLPGAR
jgi:hypothetical protein